MDEAVASVTSEINVVPDSAGVATAPVVSEKTDLRDTTVIETAAAEPPRKIARIAHTVSPRPKSDVAPTNKTQQNQPAKSNINNSQTQRKKRNGRSKDDIIIDDDDVYMFDDDDDEDDDDDGCDEEAPFKMETMLPYQSSFERFWMYLPNTDPRVNEENEKLMREVYAYTKYRRDNALDVTVKVCEKHKFDMDSNEEPPAWIFEEISDRLFEQNAQARNLSPEMRHLLTTNETDKLETDFVFLYLATRARSEQLCDCTADELAWVWEHNGCKPIFVSLLEEFCFENPEYQEDAMKILLADAPESQTYHPDTVKFLKTPVFEEWNAKVEKSTKVQMKRVDSLLRKARSELKKSPSNAAASERVEKLVAEKKQLAAQLDMENRTFENILRDSFAAKTSEILAAASVPNETGSVGDNGDADDVTIVSDSSQSVRRTSLFRASSKLSTMSVIPLSDSLLKAGPTMTESDDHVADLMLWIQLRDVSSDITKSDCGDDDDSEDEYDDINLCDGSDIDDDDNLSFIADSDEEDDDESSAVSDDSDTDVSDDTVGDLDGSDDETDDE